MQGFFADPSDYFGPLSADTTPNDTPASEDQASGEDRVSGEPRAADDGATSNDSVMTPDDFTRIDGRLSALYLELVERPEVSRADLVTAGRSAAQLDALLSRLAITGLVELQGQEIRVVPPDNALPARAVQLERQAAAARSAVSEISRRFYVARAQRSRDLDQLVRLLYSVEEMGAASAEMIAMGGDRVLAMRAPTQRILMMAALPAEVRALPLANAHGKVLSTRAIYDSRLLAALPLGTDVLLERAAHEQQRYTQDLPFSVTVVDDQAAIIDVGFPGRGAPAGLLLRTPVLVEPVLALVERFWQLSVPVPRAGALNTLDKRDRSILAMLASGASDATIARQTGVSLRTIERRIKLILDQLGAQSRFQAGLLAKERGWL